MTLFFQLIISGLGFGAIYALGAISLTLIYNTSNVVNFAAASLATSVAMLFWVFFVQLNLGLLVSWVLALIAAMVIGVVVDGVFMRRVSRAPVLIQIVLTLGLLLAIEGLVGVLFGFNPKTVPHVVHGNPIALGSVYLDQNNAFILGLTLVLALGLYYVYKKTRFGLALKAIASDRDTAALMGIRTSRYISLSWALGVLVVGVSAILAAPAVSLSPSFMESVAVFSFTAAVFGGFGSLLGALVGGLVVGIGSNLVSGYFSNNLQLTFVFLLIVIVLYVRPQGLFGEKVVSRQ